MEYVGFKKGGTLTSVLTASTGDTDIHFPSDSPVILVGGSQYGWPCGTETVSSLQGIPVNRPCVFASLSADDTAYFISPPASGRTYKVLVYNTSSSAINVTVSTNSNIGAQAILMKGSTFGSGEGMTTTSVAISVSGQHGLLLTFTLFGQIMLLEA